MLGYYDCVAHHIVHVDLRDVSFDPENRRMLKFVDEDGVVRSMPLHRIKEVFRSDMRIWHREH
ncbi:RNA repair domain-containing protein [Aromatoleum anaerobium]|uniref:RNA repair domain-containing protein n=1 Tax=Aromatoleum anaerobium TaxID=182180 RepID=UPI003CCFF096